MIGVHCFWTKPTLTGTYGHHMKRINSYKMLDFELVNFIISALMYKKYNDKIYLYTDDVFLNYLKELEFTDIWDFIDTKKSIEFEKLNINPKTNWTSFKTWLIGELEFPFLLIDHDNIICTKISDEFFNIDVRFAHLETINRDIYIEKNMFDISGFNFDEDWDWNLDIPNTSMLFFKNNEFKKIYSNLAITFEKLNNPTNENLARVQYLFADQRLLMMLIKKYKVKFGTFRNECFVGGDENVWIPYKNDLDTSSVIFDHTWVYKHTLVNNYEARKAFIIRMSNMVKTQLPSYYKQLEKYFIPYYD
jgi:hypothetical protein